MKRPKIAIISEIPTPYRQPVFQKLIHSPKFEFHVFYLNKHQRDRTWDLQIGDSIRITYLQSFQWNLYGVHTFYLTKGIQQVTGPFFDSYIIGGYAQPAMFCILRHCWKKQIPYTMVTESHFKKPRSRFRTFIKNSYLRKVYHRSRVNLVTSSFAKEYVISYGADPKKIFLTPNSIDGPQYSEKVMNLRKKKEEVKNKYRIRFKDVILFVGTLHARKGVDLLYESFVQLANEFHDLGMILVGEGPMRNKLEERIKSDHLSARVTLAGFIQEDELPNFYAMGDLFVLPSREEPFGAVICEAAAAGLPILSSSAVGANADFVIPGQNGEIFHISHPDELTDRLRSFFVNRSPLERMGKASSQIMNRWSHDYIAEQYFKAAEVSLIS